MPRALMRPRGRGSVAHVSRIHTRVNTEGSRLIGYKSQHVPSIHLAVHYPDENVYTLDILSDATVASLIMAVTCRGEDEASNTNGLANRSLGSLFFERIFREIGAVKKLKWTILIIALN